jgi:hypothetical protein
MRETEEEILKKIICFTGELSFKVRSTGADMITIEGHVPVDIGSQYYQKEKLAIAGIGKTFESALWNFCDGVKKEIQKRKEFYLSAARYMEIPQSFMEIEEMRAWLDKEGGR